MKHLATLLIILFTAFTCCTCTRSADKIIGMKIYEYDGDYDALITSWKEIGINTAFVSITLAANETFRKALKKNDIPVFIIFPVFQNPEVLQQDSSLYAITNKGLKAKDDWVEFVCPSRKAYKNAIIAELPDIIRKLNPDGISIDFIRQFVFWEMIYPDHKPGNIDIACFCDSCLAGFSQQQGITIPDTCHTTVQKANYVLMNYSDKWNTFRCDLISSMAKELSEKARQIKPGLKVSIHVIPWRENDFGGADIRVASQDLRKISAIADFISPMCYSQMLKRDATWISDVVTDMEKRAPGKILPSIQVYPYYIDQPYTEEDFKKCVEEALKSPSRGVVFFSWPLFERDPVRMEVARKVITGDLLLP